MNCPVIYKDPPKEQAVEDTRKETGIHEKARKKLTGLKSKTVTWKRVVKMPFRTPQECVGKSWNNRIAGETDKCLGRTVHPQGQFRILQRQTESSSQKGRE